jgi:AcrR family transcriptional regulator
MLSTSDKDLTVIENRILDATASCVIEMGADRVVLSEVARSAHVSRPTKYRRWPDSKSILATLITREVLRIMQDNTFEATDRESLVQEITGVMQLLRQNEFLRAIFDSGPKLMMTYWTQRFGTSQYIIIEALTAEIERAQASGTVRNGVPREMATMVVLMCQAMLQSSRLWEPFINNESMDREITIIMNGYFKP